MNKLLKLAAAGVCMIGLAACQHTVPVQAPPQSAVTSTPSQNRNVQPQTAVTARGTQQPAARAQTQQQRQSTVITLHLAQTKKESSLVEVNAGGQAPLYALPQPVLVQTDIARISPVNTDKGSFLLLEMNVRGIPKLESITQRARGNYLLLSVQGQLVDVAQIGSVIKDGRLLMATQSPQHTQAIIKLMQGKS